MSYRTIIQDLIKIVVSLQEESDKEPDKEVERFIKDLIDAGFGPANFR